MKIFNFCHSSTWIFAFYLRNAVKRYSLKTSLWGHFKMAHLKISRETWKILIRRLMSGKITSQKLVSTSTKKDYLTVCTRCKGSWRWVIVAFDTLSIRIVITVTFYSFRTLPYSFQLPMLFSALLSTLFLSLLLFSPPVCFPTCFLVFSALPWSALDCLSLQYCDIPCTSLLVPLCSALIQLRVIPIWSIGVNFRMIWNGNSPLLCTASGLPSSFLLIVVK